MGTGARGGGQEEGPMQGSLSGGWGQLRGESLKALTEQGMPT